MECSLRKKQFLGIIFVLLTVLGVGIITALGIVNYRYCQENPGGNDFLVHWTGTRNFLVNGISPYSDETALAIQTAAYGRKALPGEHELRFAYPFYSTLVFAPFALIADFTLARAIYMTFLEICLILITFASIRLVKWRPKVPSLAILFLFSLTWYHAIRPVINGNAVILVALCLVVCFLAIRDGSDEIAGVILAIATIKPQVVALVVAALIIWGITQRRYRFIFWFIGSIIFLIVLGIFFIPDWPLQNLREIFRYPGYNPPGTPGTALATWLPGTGQRIGYLLAGVLAIILFIEWWLVLRRRTEPLHQVWVLCLTLVAGQWIGIQTDPGNFIVLMLPLVLVLSLIEFRYKRLGPWVVTGACILLLVGIWSIFIGTIEYGGQPQQSPVMLFPVPMLLLVLLYWTRWWALKPRLTGFEG